MEVGPRLPVRGAGCRCCAVINAGCWQHRGTQHCAPDPQRSIIRLSLSTRSRSKRPSAVGRGLGSFSAARNDSSPRADSDQDRSGRAAIFGIIAIALEMCDRFGVFAALSVGDGGM